MITDPAITGPNNDSLQMSRTTNLADTNYNPIKGKKKSINDEYEVTELKIKTEPRNKNLPSIF